MPEITIPSKYPGKCVKCGLKFPMGTQIKYDTDKRTAEHVECPEVSYDGTEQASIFDMWVKRAQDLGGNNHG
jgi:hypothetical protein